MPPLDFVGHGSCMYPAVKVDVCSFPDVFSAQRSSQVDRRFRNVWKTQNSTFREEKMFLLK